ncbi:hypothetical protein QBC38DRAFT_73788 [Podospora fimiseda]|uniref:Rhodopsin domain-containing protein n=1 Tax=Podospora fimiseda TaxID=252190 RepID=A0AAN7BGR1_9PEZI|nr:hypothetical protein QBC38DRAFT_73788 [Podospora fimiseda]
MDWTETGTELVIFAVIIVTISALAVSLRFISRGYYVRKLGLTDWVILLSLIVNVANTIVIICHVSAGLGRHFGELTVEERKAYFKAIFAGIFVGSTSNLLTKMSVLLLFLDVFVLPAMRRITQIVMAIVAAYGVYLILSHVFFCIPVHAFWNQGYRPQKCLPGPIKWFVDSSLNITLDVTIFCLPFPFMNYMRLPWKQKLWLHVVFAVGFFVCIVSVIRIYFLALSVRSTDKSYINVQVAYWSTVEMNMGCIVACIPTYKPLINRFCPRLLASTLRNPTGFEGDYGELEEGQSHPPTISSGPSRRQQQGTESELQVL